MTSWKLSIALASLVVLGNPQEAEREPVTSEDAPEPDIMEVGEVAALAGVRRYPMRVKCATLSWHTDGSWRRVG